MAKKEKKLDYERAPSMIWYRVLRPIFTIMFRTFWPLRIVGVEHVPKEGAGVVVSNHRSMIDPFVVSYGAHRLVSFMAKEELFGVPFVGLLIRKLGGFPVDRSRKDATSMRVALSVLKGGELLGMFPEGTRSATDEMQEMRTGAVRLAAKMGVPIIPAAVVNTQNALPPGKLIRIARIEVHFGPAFDIAELYEKHDKEEATQMALEMLRERIAALHG